jgi:hypothetical protein
VGAVVQPQPGQKKVCVSITRGREGAMGDHEWGQGKGKGCGSGTARKSVRMRGK